MKSGVLSQSKGCLRYKNSGVLGNRGCLHNVLTDLKMINALTWYKNYANASTLTADFAIGSPLATFTATRSASAPATYCDANGTMQVVTASNIPRIVGGYYSDTGFIPCRGIMIEGARTNLLTRTDGTAYGNVTGGTCWTGWSQAKTTIGQPIYSNVPCTEILNIANTTAQRIQYTGVSGDSNAAVNVKSGITAVASVSEGSIITYSVLIKKSGVNSGIIVKLGINFSNAAGAFVAASFSGDIYSLITTGYRKFTYTVTAPATASRINSYVAISGIDEGDIVDISQATSQVEVAPYASTFIPTTTAALTRGAETLTYATAGNRTADEESLFMKFTSPSDFANDGIARYLASTSSKIRAIAKSGGSVNFNFYPNLSDSNACAAGYTVSGNFLKNVKQVVACIAKHSSPYVESYLLGVSKATDTNDDFTNPAWGTTFSIGSATESYWANCIIQSAAFYKRALTAPQVAKVSTFLARGT